MARRSYVHPAAFHAGTSEVRAAVDVASARVATRDVRVPDNRAAIRAELEPKGRIAILTADRVEDIEFFYPLVRRAPEPRLSPSGLAPVPRLPRQGVTSPVQSGHELISGSWMGQSVSGRPPSTA